jgi:hypothetical protein
MTLDAPDEDVARIVFTESLEMRVEAVTIHFHVQAATLTLGTDLHLSALDSCSHWKNRVVRDQSFPSLVYECLLCFSYECLLRFVLWIPIAFRGWGMHVHRALSYIAAEYMAAQYSDYRWRGWDWEDHQYVKTGITGVTRAR